MIDFSFSFKELQIKCNLNMICMSSFVADTYKDTIIISHFWPSRFVYKGYNYITTRRLKINKTKSVFLRNQNKPQRTPYFTPFYTLDIHKLGRFMKVDIHICECMSTVKWCVVWVYETILILFCKGKYRVTPYIT